MRRNKGAMLLEQALTERGMTAAQAGKEITPRSPGLPLRWIKGEVLPGLAYAIAISTAFGVPAESWTEEVDDDV
jgi:hypothetical protein